MARRTRALESLRASQNLVGSNFAGQNLENRVFSNVDLSGATFKGANLKGSIFVSSNLTGVVFEDANLENAKFSKLNGEVDCSGANLSYMTIFQCVLPNSNFSNAKFFKSRIQYSKLRNANFTGATMFQTEFGDCEMRFADFNRVKLIGTRNYFERINGIGSFINAENGFKFYDHTMFRVNGDSDDDDDSDDDEIVFGDDSTDDTAFDFDDDIINPDNKNNLSVQGRKVIDKLLLSNNIPVLQTKHLNNSFDKVNAFDLLMYSPIAISDVPDDNVIFYISGQAQGFAYPREELLKGFKDFDSLFISCDKQVTSLSVPLRESKLDIFYRINITLPMFVPIGNMKALLASNHKEWFLDVTSKIEEYTATIHLLRENNNYEHNLFGKEMNSVSRDHCQANTKQTIYELLPVEFISVNNVNKNVNKSVKKSVKKSVNTAVRKSARIGGRSSKTKKYYKKRKNSRKKKIV
jgi:hypothetical protein